MHATSDASKAAADRLLAQLERAFAARDTDGAVDSALDTVDRDTLSVEQLYCDVLAPLLAGIGTQWHTGTLHVWEEHLASAAVRTIIESMRPRVRATADAVVAARPDAEPRSAVLACPPEEWHTLGLRMLADRFAMRGWRVYYLGADVPIAEIVAASRALAADLVILEAATHYERLELRETIDGIRAKLEGTDVLVVGPSFEREHEDWDAEELLDPANLPDAYA